MRTSRFIVGLTTAGVCGLLVAGVVGTHDNARAGDGDPAPTPTTAPDNQFQPAGYVTPVSDSGSTEDIAAIRSTTTTALTAIVNTASIPKSLADSPDAAQLDYVQSDSTIDEATDTLDDVLSDQLADKTADNNSYGAAQNIEGDAPFDSDYLNYSSAEFVVDQWDGIVVDNDTATAIVEGHDQYATLNGKTRRDGLLQYEVHLVRDSTSTFGWTVTSAPAAVLED